MTVTYTLKVSNAALCGFAKLLFRWKGSIYKLLYREMLIFILLYYGLSGLYRYVLNDEQRRAFEKITIYCQAFTDLIPLSFVLGFYVSIVVARWWQQYMSIPWPDRVATLVGCHVYGTDERGRMMRRTLMRYLNLMLVVSCQGISTSVKRRFPTLDHIVEAGLMTSDEKQAYEDVPSLHGRWWIPTQWFTALLVRARQEGRIRDDILFKQILDEMLAFRGCCGMLFSYDWISIPLVYTQVVTIAIHTFFLATLMGRQYLDPDLGYKGHEVDLYVPVFTILQFFFYMGWLKVAEQLINPFGEDDDDFELNWIIDRNVQISFLIVDEMFLKHPDLVRDSFWDEVEPQLPYTKWSLNFKTEPHLGSTADLNVNATDATFVPMNPIAEEEMPRRDSSSSTAVPARNSTPLFGHKELRTTTYNEYSPLSKQCSMISLQSIRTTLNTDFRSGLIKGSGSNCDLAPAGHDHLNKQSTHDVDSTLLNNFINAAELSGPDFLHSNSDQANAVAGHQNIFSVSSLPYVNLTAASSSATSAWLNGAADQMAPNAVVMEMEQGGTLVPENVWAVNTVADGDRPPEWNQLTPRSAVSETDHCSTSINMEAFVGCGVVDAASASAATSSPPPPYPLVPVMEVDVECDSNQSTVSSVAELLYNTQIA